ncbi:hypothetical protein HMPREF0649_00660 [Segatella buccae D17]|nr:hypothetical protein HMPREF0649_00660 [Segatella buccae D17]
MYTNLIPNSSLIYKNRMTEYISRSIKKFENSGHREERLTG